MPQEYYAGPGEDTRKLNPNSPHFTQYLNELKQKALPHEHGHGSVKIQVQPPAEKSSTTRSYEKQPKAGEGSEGYLKPPVATKARSSKASKPAVQ
jgi:hypothetical protein